MGEHESQIKNNTDTDLSKDYGRADLSYEFRIYYRLARKKISCFLRNSLKKNFIEILYITTDEPPVDYITSLQKQYPDKIIKVLIPIFNKEDNHINNSSFKIYYYMQGKTDSATLYKISEYGNNVQVYGVYTDEFSTIANKQDIYEFKNLSRFAKIARQAALKLKPDFIHAENVPFLTGLELENNWLAGYPIKYIQSVQNYTIVKDTEPFIAAITFANKNELNKICNDNVIRSCIAAIFKTNPPKTTKKTMAYINYILKKYDEYRKNINREEDTRENVSLRRMNERISKIFPKMLYKNEILYNPLPFSLKQASKRIVRSESVDKPLWAKTISDIITLPMKCNLNNEHKLHDKYNIDNFRDVRFLNKKYVTREFSQKRIELKFFDVSIFEEEDVGIRGYLEPMYKTPLFFISINEFTGLQDIKTSSLAILKAFELGKNIQVIYNFPKGLNNDYLNSLFDFLESKTALKGKWLALEGKINQPQFLSAADMILIPSDNCLKIENLLYNALKYGCIPLISRNSFLNNNISDIFDDLNTGCVFKTNPVQEEGISEYESLFLKALDFYTKNNTSWNLIVKNALSYDSGWDFESIEKYNNLYDDLI